MDVPHRPKTYILRRQGRLLVIAMSIGLMLPAAFSPAVLGLGMMALEESRTGIAQNEGNSVWGLLLSHLLCMSTLLLCVRRLLTSHRCNKPTHKSSRQLVRPWGRCTRCFNLPANQVKLARIARTSKAVP